MNASTRKWISRQLHKPGPSLALVLALPGGTLLAALLWLYQQRHKGNPT